MTTAQQAKVFRLIAALAALGELSIRVAAGALDRDSFHIRVLDPESRVGSALADQFGNPLTVSVWVGDAYPADVFAASGAPVIAVVQKLYPGKRFVNPDPSKAGIV
jgi:hypothetical protein